ncbi:DUF3828 domain-containing protein [Chryseobacterium ginsenosidimutans]|uniref:DUF3828 domain-containing protein n=1 Tax=Chryseobacterium ginsenosidimutans TaxID=687846 RepID=UPI0027B9EC63|nr:DUF3828 domain-containing protein [Chryseobacterium ginsenosidimutans]
MKRIIFLFFFISAFISCKKETRTIKNNTIETLNKINNSEKAIKTLKEFYLLFYGNEKPMNDEKLMKKYVSERVLKKIDDLSSDGENLILDYDPFINGQDYDGNMIRKTLKIEPLKNENEYRVSFSLFGRKDEKKTNIDILLEEDKNENFLIYSILNNEYLNFNNSNSNINFKKQGLENWYGIYLNSDSQKLTTSESIMKKIGWYKLSIKQDEIIFESDQRMESEFPTESPGGIYINYKCDYKIVGDTIKLYEKTDDVNSSPLEISKDNLQPVLILYKKDGKYYGISDDISE